MVSKKLLLPLCFALLLVSIVSTREQETNLQSPYIDGVWYDTIDPELIVEPSSPLNASASSLDAVSTPSTTSSSIWINILLAASEDYLSYHYHTPNNGILDGWLYAELQLRRSSYWFEQKYGVKLNVVAWTTWHRDKTKHYEILDEVVSETGFHQNMMWKGRLRVEALVAYTSDLGSSMGKPICGVADNKTSAIAVRPVNYWVDENIPEHEITHLLNVLDAYTDDVYAPDNNVHCYLSDCLMSYRQVYVSTWEEDGVSWQVNAWVPVAFLYNTWCEDCKQIINAGKWEYLGYDFDPPYYYPICSGGC